MINFSAVNPQSNLDWEITVAIQSFHMTPCLVIHQQTLFGSKWLSSSKHTVQTEQKTTTKTDTLILIYTPYSPPLSPAPTSSWGGANINGQVRWVS